jgi:hypothetical protein
MMRILQGGGSIDNLSSKCPNEKIVGEEELFSMNLYASTDNGIKRPKTA